MGEAAKTRRALMGEDRRSQYRQAIWLTTDCITQSEQRDVPREERK